MKNRFPSNPYPGLRPFEFPENHLFFGREGQSEEVLRRLRESHFVAVVGTSGSGKSSLVRAGLLPLLYGGFMTEAGACWRVALFRPGDNPIHNLAAALVQPAQFTSSTSANLQTSETEELKLAVTETVLRRSAVGLRDYANGMEFENDENLLVVVDQFEELFRFKKENKSQMIVGASDVQEKAENEAAAFVKLLLEAAKETTNRVYVIITMRSDFLGDCSQFRDLPETINNGQYLIPRLTTEQLKKAIESPARVKGARIQPALVARLLNDIGDDQDQLPVLQHALMRTWDEWAKEGDKKIEINFDHYNATGGMATALSHHADEAFFELSNKRFSVEPTRKLEIAEKLFKCLTETDRENRETRRATSLGKICAIADAKIDEVISVINVFRQPGRTFLMPPFAESLDENTLIDISHESLIRKWDRLKKWVEEEAQSSQTYRRLAEDAWLNKKGKVGFWSDPELKDALDWKENFKPNATWAELYLKTWGNRYLSTYDEAISYLEESKRFREKQLSEEEAQRNREIEQERKLREQAELLAAANEREAEKAKRLAEEQQRAAELEKQKSEQAQDLVMQSKRATKAAQELAEEKEKIAQIEIEKAQVEKEKSQALEISARKLKRYLYALAAMSLLLFLIAGFAGFMWWKANQNEKAALESEKKALESKELAEVAKKSELEAKDSEFKTYQEKLEQAKIIEANNAMLREKEQNLKDSLIKQKEETEKAKTQTEIAENQRKRADEQARLARQSEGEKQKALEEQERLRIEAENKQKQAEETAQREELNRDALTALEQGENERALTNFNALLTKYNELTDAGDATARQKGVWWTKHNLGIVYSRMDKFEEAKNVFNEALNTLGEPSITELRRADKNVFQDVSYRTGDTCGGIQSKNEICISIATTLRRLAQLYHKEAGNTTDDDKWEKLNSLSIKTYDRLFEILRLEEPNTKRPDYPIEIYIEKADVFMDLNDDPWYAQAQRFYDNAQKFFGEKRNFVRQIEILKKQSNAALRWGEEENAINFLKTAIKIQEKELNLPPVSLELADSYNKISYIYSKLSKYIKSDKNLSDAAKAKADEYDVLATYYEEQAKRITELNLKFDNSEEFDWGDFVLLTDDYEKNGNCERAEKVYLFALEKINQVSEAKRFDYETNILLALGNFYRKIKRNDAKAEEQFNKIFQKIINLSEDFTKYLNTTPDDDASPINISLNRLSATADYYYEKGNLDRSITVNNKLLSFIDYALSKLAKDDYRAYSYRSLKLKTLKKLAGIYFKQDNKKDAEAKYKEAVAFAEKEYDVESSTTVATYTDLADFYFESDKPELAKALYEKNSKIAEPKIKPLVNSEKITAGYLSFFEVYIHSQQQLGKIEEKRNGSLSKSYYEKALRIMDDFAAILSSTKTTSGSEYIRTGSGKYHSLKFLTPDYYKDRADILESLAKLSEGAEATERRKQAQEARQKEQELREKQAAEAKKDSESKCKDIN